MWLQKYSQYCWFLEFVLTINRSTMVDNNKGILKNPLVFKWELFKDF